MAWPKKTWVNGEWVDFKTPGIGPPKGLPDDWRDHKGGVLGDSISYWEAIDNPLYEAAANAKGLNWEEWKAESMAEIGMKEDYVDDRERVFKDPEKDEMWAGFSKAQKHLAMGLPEFRMADRYDRGGDSGEYKDDRYDWGLDRGRFGSITDDLDAMHEWLGKTIKSHSLQDSDIITHGLDGSDYGIDGDLWAHYGLDKPPAPPKSMDVNYNFNLTEALPSSVTYSTPEGYPTLDLSTESVPYKETDFARYQADQDKAYEKWEEEWGNTSYGEPIDQTTTTTE